MTNEIETLAAQVERLTKEAAGKLVELDGRSYSTTPLFDARKPETEPKAVCLSTLSSLLEYVRSKVDDGYAAERDVFLHVVNPEQVRLITGLFGEFNQRVTVAVADAVLPSFGYGTFMDPEAFVIALMTAFEPTPARDSVLRLVSSLAAEATKTSHDDGIAQTVTARQGVVKLAELEVKNPITLRPWRTFTEVAQVESPFVLRLRGGGDGKLPWCALFEADGGTWRLSAIQRLKAHLKTELGDGILVVG